MRISLPAYFRRMLAVLVAALFASEKWAYVAFDVSSYMTYNNNNSKYPQQPSQ